MKIPYLRSRRTDSRTLTANRSAYLRRAIALWCAVGAVAASGLASAEGPGIRLGDRLVLHPGIMVGVGYDSNVFYSSGNALDPTVGAAYAAIRPYAALATSSPQRGGSEPRSVEFRLNIGLPMRFLLTPDRDVNQHWSLGVDAGMNLIIMPQGKWTFELFDTYARISQPPYYFIRASFTDGLGSNINQNLNNLGLRLRWKPGGGRFETSLQYVFGLNIFESEAVRAKNHFTNEFQLQFKWKFFPKTALYLNIHQQIFTYYNQNLFNTPPTAYPFRATLGLIGLITPKLELDVALGYGNSFTQTNAGYAAIPMKDPAYNNVVAQVGLKWKPIMLTELGIGYRHDFNQSLIGTYYDLDAAYVLWNQLIWRFTTSVRFSWERRAFQGDLTADGLVPGRIDNLLVFHAQIDFPIKDYLIISLGDDLQKNFAPDTCFLGIGPTCSYLRNDVWLRLNVAY